ncbi:MAG: hypothetical protein IKR25_11710 [Muribaculaceae bacterium]|nr:hypothetical protein [Muribaculaceae bacterium]
MDIHSVEFYVLALFVAFALLGVIFGRYDRSPARTHLAAYDVTPDETASDDEDHWVRFTGQPDGTVRIDRQGLELVPGETVNLVATIIDDKLTIVEKRGLAADGNAMPSQAHAIVDWMPTRRMHIRYESELTGEWGMVAFANRETACKQCQLRR